MGLQQQQQPTPFSPMIGGHIHHSHIHGIHHSHNNTAFNPPLPYAGPSTPPFTDPTSAFNSDPRFRGDQFGHYPNLGSVSSSSFTPGMIGGSVNTLGSQGMIGGGVTTSNNLRAFRNGMNNGQGIGGGVTFGN